MFISCLSRFYFRRKSRLKVGDRVGRIALHVLQRLRDGVVEDLQLGVRDDGEGQGG